MLEYQNLNYYQQITYIFLYIQFIFGIIGIIINILVFLTLFRPSLNQYSYSFYYRVLAISDITVLIHCFRRWFAFFLDANIDLISPFFCAVSSFLPLVSGALSVFLVTIISVDRLATMVYTHRFMALRKRWFQWTIVLIGLLTSVSINIVVPFNFHLIVVTSKNSSLSTTVCYVSSEFKSLQMKITLTHFFLVNVLINNLLNVRMIWYVISTRRKLSQLSPLSHKSTLIRDRKFAISSIGLNIASMLLILPMIIVILIQKEFNYSIDQVLAYQAIVITINVFNNAFLSFFINMFLNSLFYREFFNLLTFK